jgi:stage II sporulation protein AA (anti-sigma F factor antagonist)
MKTDINGTILTISLSGELDHHSTAEMRDKVDRAFERSGCRHLIFDLTGVEFMDSSGIGLIIGRYKNADIRGGKVAVAGMNEQLGRIYSISGLERIAKRYASVSEAGQALGEEGGNYGQ